MKAARVLQTFVNPFGMYLPSSDGKSLPFQEKKWDPNSKVFEICSRWKLMKAPEKPKKSSAQPAKAKYAEKKMKVERPQEEPVAVPTVREQKQGATRREAPGAAEVTEVGGKRQRADSDSSPAPPLVPDDFTPHEYTEADAHILTAGCSRGRDQNRHTTRQDKHKLCGRGQGGRTVFRGSARGMTYMQGHSGRLEIPLPSPTSPYVHSRVFCVRVGPCVSKCLPHVSLCVPVGRRMSKCVRTCLCNVPPSLG
ncbi:exosome complex component 10-like isoform X1 [Petromyzon marinus]|uniref:exosome complex component 10-like isoform X1 n=1 Tax=Petromyzon marinus TaxID=7757 RepID=UPI003F6E4A3A